MVLFYEGGKREEEGGKEEGKRGRRKKRKREDEGRGGKFERKYSTGMSHQVNKIMHTCHIK